MRARLWLSVKQTVEKQCDILCNLLIKENYMNDSSSQECKQQAGVVV